MAEAVGSSASREGVRRRRRVAAHSHRAGDQIAVVASVIIFMALWELLARVDWLSVDYTSKPSDIARAVPEVLGDADIREALVVTVRQMGTAFVLAGSTGVVAGLVLATSRLLRATYLPWVQFFLATPKPIFVPLFVLFFGIEPKTAILYAAFEGFFYVVVNVVSGVDLVSQRHRMVATAFGAGRRDMFLHVLLPGAMPGVVAGLWNGARHAVSGVITTQLFASAAGVAVDIKAFANTFRPDRAFVLILCLSVLALIINAITRAVEARFTGWRTTVRGDR